LQKNTIFSMKFLILASIFALAVHGRTLEGDSQWRPAQWPSDFSKYKSPLPKLVSSGMASRIVGGHEVNPPHSQPHQVALFIDGMYFCGGSLISETKVLTAAHCTQHAHRVKVVLGAHDPKNDAEAVEITATEFAVHPDWDQSDIGGGNDVSVITLPEPATLTETIKTIELAESAPTVGSQTTVTGWGKTRDFLGGLSKVLMEVEVPIISQKDCEAAFSGESISKTILCTSGEGAKGTCSGDSGGPLQFEGKQVGIVSFGSSAGCKKGYPDGFTSVADYRDWILSH